MAWLDAAPIPKQPQNHRAAHNQQPPVQRRKNPAIRATMPDISPIAYVMVHYLQKLLASSQKGHEISAITYSEINNWMMATGTTLSPDSVEFLQSLSVIYVSQFELASSPECPQPFGSVKITNEIRSEVSDAMMLRREAAMKKRGVLSCS